MSCVSEWRPIVEHVSSSPDATFKDYAKLHFIVLIWGFTGILGALISLPTMNLVVYRTALAALGLVLLMLWNRRSLSTDPAMLLKLLGTGLLVGLHWVLFFGAVKAGGASIGMIGLSTATLWSALMGPFFSKQSVSSLEVFLGVLVVGALGYILNAEFRHAEGLILSVLAGLVAALFSFLNGSFVRVVHHHTIALYEMIGALIFAWIAAWVSGQWEWQAPSDQDWLYLLALAWACTVYPYSECVALLKKISVFATNLSVNMEPVYGMILAALILQEHHVLTFRFYVGSALIIASVLLYPVARRARRYQLKRRGSDI